MPDKICIRRSRTGSVCNLLLTLRFLKRTFLPRETAVSELSSGEHDFLNNFKRIFPQRLSNCKDLKALLHPEDRFRGSGGIETPGRFCCFFRRKSRKGQVIINETDLC